MTSKQHRTIVFAAIPALAAAGFILDLLTPLSVADWVWYFIPLLLSVYVGGRFFPYVLAAVFSVLTLVGYFLSPPGIDFHSAFMSRLMGICVQWLTAFLISQRKGVEGELFKSRQILRLILDTIPQRVFWKDRSLKYLGCNRHFALDGGYSDPNELVGKNDYEASWKAVADRYRADDQQVLETGKPKLNYDEPQVRLDRSRLWLTTSKVPLLDQDGRVIGVLGTYEDITERKRAEEALRESKDYLEKIINAVGDPMFVKDRQHRLVLVNEAECRLAGRTREELLGKTDYDFFPKEQVDVFWQMDELVFETGQVNINEETITNAAGELRTIVTKKSRFINPSGQAFIVGVIRDITERKRAEETLRKSEQKYRELVEHANSIIVRWKHDGQITFLNEFGQKFFGYSAAEILGRHIVGTIVPETESTGRDLRPLMDQIRADPKAFEQNVNENMRRNGERVWIAWTNKVVLDEQGRVSEILSIGTDITERKRADETLANERALLRTLVDHLPMAIYLKDLAGRKTLVNRVELDYVGATSEAEVLGKTDFDFFPPEQAAGYQATDQEVIRTGQPVINHESSFTKPDGSVIHLMGSVVPLRDVAGHVTGLAGINCDITDRKQAEEHIREQAALLDKAQDAILVLDLDNRIVYWNKSAERIYGWSAAEAIGKNPVDLFLGGAISPRHAEAIKAVNERGEWSGELQEITKNGETVTVQGRWNVICDEQGRPKSRLIINGDITEKKKLEAQFLRAQRMEGLGALAGGIAHDLNNVLTPLLVSVQVLKQKITDADGQRLLEALETNVQRGASLVKQVLAFGRGVTGERVSVHPKHIAREIRQIVRETFPKSVVFELHSDDDLWTIIGDPTQLQQVLLNLCVNARDAMPNGGKLSIHMENVVLDEAYAGMNPEARHGPYVLIKVADTGAGIPKEIQDKIFDPFFTTKEPGKGTGLGLSTTLGIVKSYGGFINCYSEPGKGSIFKVFLPANTTRADMEKVVAGEAKLPRGHNELVLVVDDEEPIRELAQKVLERFGYRALLAADGTEAVSLYQPRRNEIDVVITDMIMPNMDGPATIAALKAINPEIKIVGSSGLTPDGYEAAATKAGVRHFIPKPYTAETMLLTLHEVLNGKR